MTLPGVPLIAFVVLGQVYSSPSPVGSTAPSGFAASFDSLYKDFGTVPHGSQSVHRFTFTNKTDKEVVVTSVRSSCHCATPRAVTTIAKPGEKLEIEVIYDAKKFLNERSMTITVDMQSDHYEQVQLRVRGFSRQDVILEPGQLDFGVAKIGKEQKQTIRLEYAGPLDWRVLDVVNGQWAKAKVEEKSRGGGMVKYEVALTVPPNAPRGRFVDAVQLKTNSTRPSCRFHCVPPRAKKPSTLWKSNSGPTNRASSKGRSTSALSPRANSFPSKSSHKRSK
jgi:hypothetical protein